MGKEVRQQVCFQRGVFRHSCDGDIGWTCDWSCWARWPMRVSLAAFFKRRVERGWAACRGASNALFFFFFTFLREGCIGKEVVWLNDLCALAVCLLNSKDTRKRVRERQRFDASFGGRTNLSFLSPSHLFFFFICDPLWSCGRDTAVCLSYGVLLLSLTFTERQKRNINSAGVKSPSPLVFLKHSHIAPPHLVFFFFRTFCVLYYCCCFFCF